MDMGSLFIIFRRRLSCIHRNEGTGTCRLVTLSFLMDDAMSPQFFSLSHFHRLNLKQGRLSCDLEGLVHLYRWTFDEEMVTGFFAFFQSPFLPLLDHA